jgi:ABC-type transporter Mla maintaining outer membrane lipid asymmetry permease subunit MlaE
VAIRSARVAEASASIDAARLLMFRDIHETYNAVARGESRSRYQLVSFASIAVVVGIGLLVAFAIGVVVALLAAAIAQVSTAGVGDTETLKTLPELLGRGWLALAEACALGFAIATLALAVGLKVDADAVPSPLLDQLKAGQVNLNDPATRIRQ